MAWHMTCLFLKMRVYEKALYRQLIVHNIKGLAFSKAFLETIFSKYYTINKFYNPSRPNRGFLPQCVTFAPSELNNGLNPDAADASSADYLALIARLTGVSDKAVSGDVPGSDLYHPLKGGIPFPLLLEAKLRHAAETGESI
ncbi:hypothetical protein [Photorhabdus stackebrandtii]|uniref:hypothetical protein n=1 Tax=Photorhabdus stackebrandtii TaxID=1123042 RepID=UPI001F61D6EA|nr:hypothetical protein [Photorhabdus stackebrandtii]